VKPVAGDVDHLKPGLALPRLVLPATSGGDICLADAPGRSVIFVYPWTGRPGHPNPPNWDDMPGAHGSTPELEGARDQAAAFAALKVALFGLSRQDHRLAARTWEPPSPAVPDPERCGRTLHRGARLADFRNRRRYLFETTHACDQGWARRAGVLSRAAA